MYTHMYSRYTFTRCIGTRIIEYVSNPVNSKYFKQVTPKDFERLFFEQTFLQPCIHINAYMYRYGRMYVHM